MAQYPTHTPATINQELRDFLANEEKQLLKHPPENNSKRSHALSIKNQYEYAQKDTINTKELQKLKNIIQNTFSSFTSQLQNQNNLDSNIEDERQLNQNNKKEIQQQDEQIKKKQEQISRLKRDLQQQDIRIFQMRHNHELQLANKDRVIQQLQAKLRKCKATLKALKIPILNLKQDLLVFKVQHSKKTCFQVEQKIMNEQLKIIFLKKKVQQAEKVNKEKEKLKEQYNLIFQEIQLSQRDLSKIAGFTIDQQPTTRNKLKVFYNQLETYIKYSNAFIDSTIIEGQDQKKWLLQRVSQTIGGRYFKTRMIFKFDSLNKTTFHQYIDGKPNILLIVKLINGYKIGGFCKTPIQKQRIEKHKDGFLYSLTLKEKYEPKSANQALVSYDDFFLIFGNSEVRIKSFETKVFSNFGTNCGVFATYGKKSADFLGSVTNEIELFHFQIYEITRNQL